MSELAPVVLTWEEIFFAALGGMRRQLNGIRNRIPHAHGWDARDAWGDHIEGAIGECAVAKHLDRFWVPSALRFDRDGDIGNGTHVRATTNAAGSLILHDGDPDEGLFYLALTGALPTVRVGGPLLARDGKQRVYWRDDGRVRHPAYFVPQRALV